MGFSPVPDPPNGYSFSARLRFDAEGGVTTVNPFDIEVALPPIAITGGVIEGFLSTDGNVITANLFAENLEPFGIPPTATLEATRLTDPDFALP